MGKLPRRAETATEPADAPAATHAAAGTPGFSTASVTMLKALAHPLRQQIFRALTSRGHARAADLSAALGIPANTASFHLRVLADAHIIEEAPEHARDKRERVWKPKSGSWDLGSPQRPAQDEALTGAVTNWLVAELYSTIQRLVAWAPEYTSGRSSAVHGSLVLLDLWLSDEDFAGLTEELGAVLERYAGREKAEGRRRWQVGIVAADDQI